MRGVVGILMFLLFGCVVHPALYIGGEYLGVPYGASPLGEGGGIDPDPLIRFDMFDCTTFVETALAAGDVEKLTRIRYKDGEIGFENRNHFIESDWMENNAEYVENVSRLYAPTAIRHIVIDKSKWAQRVHNIEYVTPPREINLEYIPYKNLEKISVSEPMIILFINGKSEKSDMMGTDMAVNHMGFLLPNGILRHASSARKAVVDVPFDEYVAVRRKQKNEIGISVVKIK